MNLSALFFRLQPLVLLLFCSAHAFEPDRLLKTQTLKTSPLAKSLLTIYTSALSSVNKKTQKNRQHSKVVFQIASIYLSFNTSKAALVNSSTTFGGVIENISCLFILKSTCLSLILWSWFDNNESFKGGNSELTLNILLQVKYFSDCI